MKRVLAAAVSAIVLAAAVACMLVGIVDPAATANYRLGLLLAVFGTTGLVCARSTVAADLIERARQDGYDAGYADGCEVSRSARVVGIGSSSSRRRLSRRSATHQLGQESDLAGSADRVI